jgi:hypothetical protein
MNTPEGPDKIPDQTRMPEHVQIVFKELFAGLESIKQQQWKIANYAILLLAATYALKGKIDPTLFSHLVWATGGLGSLLLLRLQWNLGRYRRRIDRIHSRYFTPQELMAVGVPESDREGLERKTVLQQSVRGLEFISALIAVLVLGAVLVYLAPPLNVSEKAPTETESATGSVPMPQPRPGRSR